jgi:hypothetical protein
VDFPTPSAQPAALRDGFLAAGARLRNAVFLLAVLTIIYTWSRPSPVDVIFLGALLLTPFSAQKFNLRCLLLISLLSAWLLSIYISSASLLDRPLVEFQLFAMTSVVLIGVTSCLVVSGWGESDLLRFIEVYIFASAIAAVIGIAGFALHNPDLTWADRPTAFLDDPDMFGVLLLPGMFGCLLMIAQQRHSLLHGAALLLLGLALILSFSRAAIAAGFILGAIYFLFLNRRNLFRASLAAVAVLTFLMVAFTVWSYVDNTFAQMLADRSKLAESYDLGHFGRYNRYLLAMPMILDNPLGLGLTEIDKYFPEPIHNIWISAFLNYGWLGGFDWTLLMVLSIQQAWYTWRRSRHPMCLFVLFSWLAIISCAMVQQGERWRFLWLFTGMLWGINERTFAVRAAPRSAGSSAALPPQAGAALARPL